MRITTTVLEGTPDELAAYQAAREPQIDTDSTLTVVGMAATATDASDSPPQFVKLDVARRVLTRRPLSTEQKTVLKTLYEAHPNKVSALDLQRATKYNPRQLAGLMGAFGRRVINTPGARKKDNFFDWTWADDGWRYGLPESVRNAMQAEKLV